MFQVEAVRGLLVGAGLPVNVKFLVEGEEEVGSPNFEALLEAERERLACDVVVVSDTDMWAPDVPSVCVGMRGLIATGWRSGRHRWTCTPGCSGARCPTRPTSSPAWSPPSTTATSGSPCPASTTDVRPLTAAEEASMAAIPSTRSVWRAMAGVKRWRARPGARC